MNRKLFRGAFRAPVLVLLLVCGIAAADSLRVAGNRLFVPIEVNGVQTEALLDSGAELTLIDAAFAEQLSLLAVGEETAKGTGGTAQVSFVEHVDIETSGTRLGDLTVVVLDLTDIAARLVGEPVTVVVGRELFDAGIFVLDIERGQFQKVSDDHEPQGVRLSLTDHQGIKQMPIQVDGGEVRADFDLGNGNEVLIGQPYAIANDLLAEERIVGSKEGGGIGGSVSRDLVELESITIAGAGFESVTAAIDATDNATDANVGVSLLRHFVMTIDFPGNAIWLAPGE